MHVPVEILKYSKTLLIVNDNAVRPSFSFTESSQKRKLSSSSSFSSEETLPKPPRRRLSPPVFGSIPMPTRRRCCSDQSFSRWDSSPATLAKEKADVTPLMSLKQCAKDARRLLQQRQPLQPSQFQAENDSFVTPPKKPLRRGSNDRLLTTDILDKALRIAASEDLEGDDLSDAAPADSSSDYLVNALELLHIPF